MPRYLRSLRWHRPGAPGYWVGAVVFNTAFAIGSFLLTFGLVLWLTWPSVPWDWLAARGSKLEARSS